MIFDMQKALDEKINLKRKTNHPNLTHKEIEIQKNLALIVEAGEFVNEVQSFKYWKMNKNIDQSAIKEEFADLLHFLVTFGYEHKVDSYIEPKIVSNDINVQFQELFVAIAKLMQEINHDHIKHIFEIALGSFVMLGYDYGDLFEAYFFKNQKNYQRLKNNY
ncbi:Uncharacterized protein conserved in bacteria [Mycoplasmopsis glycophila]|uniref:Uncharacterized protein conserved in bacteria n=2 Tax=Mycoplasmopsis glycophila TaxID=171285 RepID=A0A449AWK8_9BACT|nr:Uncharacterized protein conserved in bacteria [Mycoplasmopsis glycophila]